MEISERVFGFGGADTGERDILRRIELHDGEEEIGAGNRIYHD